MITFEVPQLQAASSIEDFPLAAVLQLLGKCQTAGCWGPQPLAMP